MEFLFDTRGFRGVNNNCFLNCLFMVMFGYIKSPFFEIREFKSKKDQSVYNHILGLVHQMSQDRLPDCTQLRNILPKEMSYGQQDVSEIYDYLMKMFNFDPIRVYNHKQYKTETGEIKENKPEKQDVPYITIENDGTQNYNIVEKIFRGYWEDLGEDKSNWIKEDNGKPKYRYIKRFISKVKGKCVVMYINRGNQFTGKYKNNVLVPDYIEIGNTKYFRFGSILHMSSGSINHGHYIAILWNGKEKNYVFDDTNNKKVSQCEIDPKKAKEMIQMNSIMIFYFIV